MRRPRRRFVFWGHFFAAASIALGLLLATHERFETAGCSLGPCDPASTLPYMWPGVVLLSAGVPIGLCLIALALAAWGRRIPGQGRAAMGIEVGLIAVGTLGFSASLAVVIVAGITRAWTTVVLLVPWSGFFGMVTLIGLGGLWKRHRHAASI